jgi:hypothetical protein
MGELSIEQKKALARARARAKISAATGSGMEPGAVAGGPQFGPPEAPIVKNPDGTYGKPPEGMVLNPNTGQFTSRELLANTMAPNAAGSAIAGGGQGATFGAADEMAGGLNAIIPGQGTMGERYDFGREYARAMVDSSRRDHPVAAYGGEIAAAMALPGASIKAAQGASLPVRAGIGMAAGAGQGAAYGFGAGEGSLNERAQNAAISGGIGATLGGAIPAIGQLFQKAANNKATKKAIADLVAKAPTSEQLRAMGRSAYSQIDQAGVSVKPDVVKSGMDDIASTLGAEGAALDVGSRVFPAGRAIMDAAKTATDGKTTIPFNELDVFRRFVGGAARANPQNGADTRLAGIAMGKIDDLVNNLKPGDVDAGDLQALQTLLPKARDLWARMSKSQKIDDAIEAGDNYLSGSASGIRNQFSRILKNPKLAQGFSEVEKEAMRRVARGTIPEQAIHVAAGGLGKLLTTLGGGFTGGIGGAAGGLAISAGLGRASESIVRKNAEIARALVAAGGMSAPAKSQSAFPSIVEALLQRGSRPVSPIFGQLIAGQSAPR